MIRQPKRDERRQIIPLIELIMQDMELPILEHTSPGNALRDARGSHARRPVSLRTEEHARLYS